MAETTSHSSRSIEEIISSISSNCVYFGIFVDPYTEFDANTINYNKSDCLDALIHILKDWLDYYDLTGKKIKLSEWIDEKIDNLYELRDVISKSVPRLGRRILNDYLDRYSKVCSHNEGHDIPTGDSSF